MIPVHHNSLAFLDAICYNMLRLRQNGVGVEDMGVDCLGGKRGLNEGN